jgi:hypothetical protein
MSFFRRGPYHCITEAILCNADTLGLLLAFPYLLHVPVYDTPFV